MWVPLALQILEHVGQREWLLSSFLFFFFFFTFVSLALQMYIVHKVTDAEVELAKTRMKAFLYQQVHARRVNIHE